jgi:uncharacterized protein (AIM24 family)
MSMKSLIGRGSGESVQLAFSGTGWLLIQPSEGVLEGGQTASRGRGGGLGDFLGN